MTGFEEIGALATSAASAAASAAPYLSIGAGLVSAAGSVAAGNAQRAALLQNAAVDKVNAGTALETSEASAQRQQLQAQRSVAAGVNQVAGSGIQTSSGSPLDVMADAAAQGALDTEITRWKGQSTSNAYLTQSGIATNQADQAQDAGFVQAGSTLLTAGARYAAGRLPPQYPV